MQQIYKITFLVLKLMRRHLLVILLFVIFQVSSFAQKLNVESFSISESDLSAQTQPRKDLNEKNCALVKVGIGLQGVRFEGNIVGKVESKTGEYWVYMPRGSRMLKVKHPNYSPTMITFANYGIEKLESNRTYEVMLSVSRGNLPSQTQTLTIKYAPTDATVLVDNKRIKGSDGVAIANLPVGQHNFVVFCDGYESEEGMVKLKASAPSKLQITLSKETNATSFSVMGEDVANQNSANSQVVKFLGKVVDVKGDPVIGALIRVNGTSNSAITDLDGKFFVESKTPTVTVTISYVGWQSKQVDLVPGYEEQITLIENKKKELVSSNTISIPVKDGVCIEMVKVEAGTFMMGATPEMKNPEDDEKPAHCVVLTKDYYLGKYEVSQALWQAVTGSNPSKFKDENLPVECVSWDDCMAFISKLNDMTGRNFRLPTEAEWEYAACGGKRNHGFQYSGGNNLADYAWFDKNSESKTHVIGTKLPNELGIFDMSGNVLEWCQDWHQDWSKSKVFSSSIQTNPICQTGEKGHVIRGGCWATDANYCRSSYRNIFLYSNGKNGRNSWVGLRLALTDK